MHIPHNAFMVIALGLDCAFAQPAIRQKQRRDLADVNWNTVSYDVNWSTVNYGGAVATSSPAAVAAPAATTSAAGHVDGSPLSHSHHHNHKATSVESSAAAGSTGSSSPDSSSSGAKSFGGVTEPKDNGNYDEYIGNVGQPYGSNMIMLDNADDAQKYKYSNTFTNPTSGEIKVIVWNKSGKDGRPQSGMGLPPLINFSLGPNESKAIAFDENSQVAFSQDCERDPLKGNLPNCTWGELDFGDLRNGGWSGYDRSSIPNGAGNTGLLTIKCDGAKTSSKEENSFTSAAQTNAGGALAPGPAHFFTTMGA